MAIDRDDPVSLPEPPPPRPAARRAAIDAAMRRFDGAEPEKPVRQRASWSGWVPRDRRAIGAFATAAVIAVVSVPVALTTLRDNPPPSVVPQAQAPSEFQPSNDASAQDRSAPEVAQDRSGEALVAAEPSSTAPSSESPPLMSVTADEMVATTERKEVQAAPTTAMAAAPAAPPPPPPPPAPPPPPPPQNAPQFAGEAAADSVVVTGSRIERPNLSKQGRAERRAAESASPLAVIDSYGAFLSELQAAFRANDRRAVIALVALPLRVRLDGETRAYRSAQDVERDFDRIFTPQVRQSVLGQRRDRLRSRGSRMMGTGKLWFGPSSAGPMRIREVTP